MKHGIDGSVTFDEDEVKNLAAFVHGDEALYEEVKDHLQEVFDKSTDEQEGAEAKEEEEG